MGLHDFRCAQCHHVEADMAVEQGTTELPCPACDEGVMAITYENWTTFHVANGGKSVDNRVAADGTISMLGASDSKLCRVELGLSDRPHDRGLRTFTPEQSMEFRKRIMAEGSKPRQDRKIFEDIIKTRKENLAKRSS